ncbi:oligosaccharide flippase family protein [Geobacter sp. OR-1]|uniref:lipopolysaccharide biosynthesis protein n=1 Tax=Geobacter sp. OR-1 TaxID=1266765 RepID=UPI0009DFFFCC
MLRDNIKNIFKHTSIYSLGWIASSLAGIILLPIYSKYMSRADYGAVDLVQQANAIIRIIFSSSFNVAVSKFYHEAENDRERKKCHINKCYRSICIRNNCIIFLCDI